MNRRRFIGTATALFSAPWLARAATLVCRQPYVQRVRRTGATISWATAEKGAATLQIQGPDGFKRTVNATSVPVLPGQMGAPTGFIRHWARAEDLEPGTEYSYSISLDGRDISPPADLRFRTAGQQSFTFLAIGDSGTGSEDQLRLAETFQKDPAALVIHTGDLAYPTGTFESYDRNYFDVYQQAMRRVPFFPVPGNHDYYDFAAEPYRALHDLPSVNAPDEDQGRYYSFDWGDVHFIALDSNAPLEAAAAGRGDMLRWLEEDLAETNKFWRIAFFHHPPYANGPNNDDAFTDLARRFLVPILERHHVPLILGGHEHSYQRSVPIRAGQPAPDGATYITTGGGGASLYPVYDSPLNAAAASVFHYLRAEVTGRQLKITAIDTNGASFDSVLLAPRPVIHGEVVNAASGTPAFGRGSLASVYGWQFAPEVLPNGAGDVRIIVGGLPARVLAVAPTQINCLLPEELQGDQMMEVTTPSGVATARIHIRSVAPALFEGSILNSSGVQVTATTPALPGAHLSVHLTGAGEWDGPVALRLAGALIPAQLTAGPPGVQILRFDLPLILPAGAHPLQAEASGERSNQILLHSRR